MKNLPPKKSYFVIIQWLTISVVSSLLYFPTTLADANQRHHPILEKKLQQLSLSSIDNIFPLPLSVETQYSQGQGSTHLYLLSDISFSTFANFFGRDTWCEALILQIHIKACRQYENNILDIYLGTDDYAEPVDVFKFEYKLSNQHLAADYLTISMTAKDGPMDSKNYHINLEIIPTKDHKSLIHFHFEAYYGFFIRAGISTYLMTAGRNKVGFKILNPGSTDKPKFQTGMEGILERNAMRYVLAFLSYLETNPRGETINWLDKGLRRWHRYTEQFYQQLYEISLPDYITLKNAEYKNQLNLSLPDNSTSSNEEWPGD